MRFNLRRMRWRWALAALAVAGGGVALWRIRLPEAVADRWIHAQVRTLPDEDLERWLSGFAKARGAAGLALVVSDLESPRAALREAARDILIAECESWTTRPSSSAKSLAVSVAEALRTLDRTAFSQEASEITGRVMAWADRVDCPPESRRQVILALRGLPSTYVAQVPAVEPLLSAAPTTIKMPAPPQRLPREESQAAPIQPSAFEAKAPSRIVVPVHVEDAPSLRLPGGAADEDADIDWNLAPLPTNGTENPTAPAAPSPLADAEKLREVPTEQLLALLADEGRSTAQVELERRGFTAEQLELARHLSSPDAAERRAWTEALPRVNQIDSQAWLTWKLSDADASVRRAAITLLATTMNDETAELLRKLAVADPDRDIRRFATEMLENQDSR